MKFPSYLLFGLGSTSLLYKSFFLPPKDNIQDQLLFSQDILLDVIALGVSIFATEWISERCYPASYFFICVPILIIVVSIILRVIISRKNNENFSNKKSLL